MINMSITPAGVNAISELAGIIFTQFKAGDGHNSERTGLVSPRQDVPIAYAQTYLAGHEYAINGVTTTVDYNAVKICGTLLSTQAPEAYDWTELALMAKVGIAGEEFAFAYGAIEQNAFRIDPQESVTFTIPFDVVFSETPNVTVNTTETGVTWSDLLEHVHASVSNGNTHGLKVMDNDLYVDNQPAGLAKIADILAMEGLEAIVSTLPQPSLAWLGKCIFDRTAGHTYKLVKTVEVGAGMFVIPNEYSYAIGNGTEDGALLVVEDVVTPSADEMALGEAQSHFLEWQIVDDILSRLEDLECNSDHGSLTVNTFDNTEYNSEWVSRMTGSGTEASPYIIYTPYDFNEIRNNLSACYRLANNLDFSDIIGIPISIANDLVCYGTVNPDAPLYNNGQGWIPITDLFSGTLDGNGKVIRGLTSCSNATKGLFNSISNAKIMSLTLKDGYIICSSNNAVEMAAFVGNTWENCLLQNLVNYNTVCCTSMNNTQFLSGIVGHLNHNNYVTCTLNGCANHGRLISYNPSATLCGICYCTKYKLRASNCYNTAALVGGTVYGFGLVSTADATISNCYSGGILVGTNGAYALCGDNSNLTCTNCYARSDYGTSCQGTTVTPEFMLTEEFLALLNNGLVYDIFYRDTANINQGLPVLQFEQTASEAIPGTLPLALLDSAGNSIYSSKFSYNKLASLVTRQEVRNMLPTISFPTITLSSDRWSENSDTFLYEQTVDIDGVTTTSIINIIPKSVECFTSNVEVATLATDSVTFTASVPPEADISVGLIVVVTR